MVDAMAEEKDHLSAGAVPALLHSGFRIMAVHGRDPDPAHVPAAASEVEWHVGPDRRSFASARCTRG